MFLLKNEFKKGKVDNTLFLKTRGKELLIVQDYIDGMIFGATSDCLCKEFVELMSSEFEISLMGELTFLLGLQIKQSSQVTSICQEKYIKELPNKFKMLDPRVLDTPISTSARIDEQEAGKEVSQTMYKEIIESLLYLTVRRQDIVFSVGMCDRFQVAPKEVHLKTAKKGLAISEGNVGPSPFY